jgi:hypothetical protein
VFNIPTRRLSTVAAKTKGYTITGGTKTYPSGAVALSAAITYAGRLKEEGTVYVRDVKGDSRGYVERDEDGVLFVRRFERGR